MVAKILTGIQVTSVNYQQYAKGIWITCLCLGLLLEFFGQDAPAGVALITLSIIGLPAYFIDAAQKSKKKGGK